MPRLENWKIQTFSDGEQCLWGEVYDDHRYNPDTGEFADGNTIRTTLIREMAEDETWAVTCHTKYELGRKLEVNK